MAQKKKIRVAVLYGGRSGEHEVSLRSAASVIHHLSSERYEIIPVAIDKQGRWHLNDLSLIQKSDSVLPVLKDAPTVLLPPNPPVDPSAGTALIRIGGSSDSRGVASSGTRDIDVVFPVMHGTYCEDGTIQGLLELADVPYVGCGVLAKTKIAERGSFTCPFTVIRRPTRTAA